LRKSLLIGYFIAALTPLAILFSLATISCVLSYFILMAIGDVWPLSKMIKKLTQVLLVLSIFPLRTYLKLSWTELGFSPTSIFFKQLIKGLVFGVMTLLPVLWLLYFLEVHVFDQTKTWTLEIVVRKTSISLFLALLISCVEEPIFRGVLLTGLRQKMATWAAIVIGSTYYGSLHFLETSTKIPYQYITLKSSFMLFGEAIRAWTNPAVLPAFLGLFMVGIFLSVVRTQIKQSLGLCIGFHASWVLQIKLSKDFFNTNYSSPYLYLVSSYDGLVGPLIAAWLFLATIFYLAYRHWHRYR